MTSSPDPLDAPPTTEDLLVGRTIGKYEVLRVIGRGGMGTVYEALNTSIGKRVAMKFVDAELARNKDAVARFQREAQAASAVESAHIVQIFDAGATDEGLPFLVMELLRGEDLGHRIKRCGRLDLGEAAHVTAQILRGLHRAHEAGIVHRDLKPDNVFLVDRDDDANFAKILDFGISKMQRRGEIPANTLTRKGTVLGTPFYMSPEQAQALADIDGRADLWSVGAILYECLTGRPPHGGGTYEQVIIAICTRDADDVRLHNPAMPAAVAEVVARALRRGRDERFGSARDFLDALVGAAGGAISGGAGRMSGDDAVSAPRGVVSSPGIGRTPVARDTEPSSLAPTLEVPGDALPRGGEAAAAPAARSRRGPVYALVAAGALGVGAVVALAAAGRDEPRPAPATPAPVEVEVALTSNVAGARFSVDGAALERGVLRGPAGASRRVRAEAEGYAPVERDVVLDAALGRVAIALEPPAPSVDPAPPPVEPAEPAATAAPSGAAKAKLPQKPASTTLPPLPPTKPTGVAGGLKLKED
jgi:serine/threonine-protein kinase